MSTWLNNKFGTSWGAAKWSLVLGLAVLSLVLVASLSFVFATTTTWDFSSPGNYTYDSDKMEVVKGVAKLKSDFTVTHNTQMLFNTGTFSDTESVVNPDGVQLTQSAIGAAEASKPARGTYTSVIVDSGVSDTKWNTLSISRMLQQASPPATFGPRQSGTRAPGSDYIRNMSFGDMNIDGSDDLVVPENANTSDATLFYFQSGNPMPSPLHQRWITNDNSPIGSPCIGNDGAPTESGNRHWEYPPLIADFNNDLLPDVLEARQKLANNVGLFLYQNPYVPGQGSTFDPPQCFAQKAQSGSGRRIFEDIRLANINRDLYTNEDIYADGRDIFDAVVVERAIGKGNTASPSGGVFWLRNDGTTAPDSPSFGLRSIDACSLGSAAETGPSTVVAADLDNDGDEDVIAGWQSDMASCADSQGAIRPATSSEIRGYINNADDDPPTWSPAISSGTSAPGWQIYDLPENAGSVVGDYSGSIEVADMNGDGYLDIVYAHIGVASTKYDSKIYWLENPCTSTPCVDGTGAGELRSAWIKHDVDLSAESSTASSPSKGDFGIQIVAVDIDLDGDIDLIANNSFEDSTQGVTYYENTGNGTSWDKHSGGNLATSKGAGIVIAPNLTSKEGDRAFDLAATNTSGGSTIDWWKNTTPHSNIYFQVRSCGNASCGDSPFIGPDGRTTSYYGMNGHSGSITESIKVPDNQYFQYRVYFYSNDEDMNPRLASAAVSYTRAYYTDSPSIYPTNGVNFSRINGFDVTLGENNDPKASITYQICTTVDGCYYWNGADWIAALSAENSNSAADVKLHIDQFEDSAGLTAAGNWQKAWYFKAFFNSDGQTLPELDQVQGESDIISLGLLTNPDQDGEYEVGNNVSIEWSSYTCEGSPCGSLVLQYSVDSTDGVNGAWTLIGEVSGISNGSPSNPSSYSWEIPSDARSDESCNPPDDYTGCTSIRVYSLHVPVIRRWTGGFKVGSTGTGSLDISEPNGTSVFVVGDPMSIQWTYSGDIKEPIRIDYSLNNGDDGYAYSIAGDIPKGSAGSGSYAWASIPEAAVSDQFRIRVSDSNDTPVAALTSFFVIKGSLGAGLVSPSPGSEAGESHTPGQASTIAWNATSVPYVKIEISRNASDESPTWETIAASVASDVANGECTIPDGASGCYEWNISGGTATADSKIRVSDVRQGFGPSDANPVFALSPNPFSITAGGGGETPKLVLLRADLKLVGSDCDVNEAEASMLRTEGVISVDIEGKKGHLLVTYKEGSLTPAQMVEIVGARMKGIDKIGKMQGGNKAISRSCIAEVKGNKNL